MKEYFEALCKRKSVRDFSDDCKISKDVYDNIMKKLDMLMPLDGDIKVNFEIAERRDTSAKFGEYCLLMYSEKKPGYLINAGYMLEQMDLYFALNNIGVCWYGLAKPEKKVDAGGLDFVIMLAFGQCGEKDFRYDRRDFLRKPFSENFDSNTALEALKTSLYAPSACNTQPWYVEGKDGLISVYRDTNVAARLPKAMISYFNSIDMGIYMLCLEVSLQHYEYIFERRFYNSEQMDIKGRIKIAEYKIL